MGPGPCSAMDIIHLVASLVLIFATNDCQQACLEVAEVWYVTHSSRGVDRNLSLSTCKRQPLYSSVFLYKRLRGHRAAVSQQPSTHQRVGFGRWRSLGITCAAAAMLHAPNCQLRPGMTKACKTMQTKTCAWMHPHAGLAPLRAVNGYE